MNPADDHMFTCPTLTCPQCGRHTILGVLLTNEHGKHMHTWYICTFWGGDPTPGGGVNPRLHCGWTGWNIADDETRVREAASQVFTAEGVDLWMDAPNPSLNGATPLQFVAGGDTDRVLDVIAGLADGVTG